MTARTVYMQPAIHRVVAYHQIGAMMTMAVLVDVRRAILVGHDRAKVSSRIESPGAQPIQVDYHLFHTGGRWKVYDVVVDGVSLLINYREVFASELQHESLDGLITRLEQKVSTSGSSGSQ